MPTPPRAAAPIKFSTRLTNTVGATTAGSPGVAHAALLGKAGPLGQQFLGLRFDRRLDLDPGGEHGHDHHGDHCLRRPGGRLSLAVLVDDHASPMTFDNIADKCVPSNSSCRPRWPRRPRIAQSGDRHDRALAVLGADDGGEANLTYTWARPATAGRRDFRPTAPTPPRTPPPRSARPAATTSR